MIRIQPLSIAATTSSPQIVADPGEGTLVISGESYPENSFELFRPVLDWTNDFLAQGTQPLVVEFRLSYLNTSSIKCVMDLLDALEGAHVAGRAVTVTWYYDEDNDRALDLADEFREDLTLPFATTPIALQDGRP